VPGLPGAEGDDAADRIVGGHTNGDAITWHDLDSEAAHAAAQLREYLMSRVALHAVKPTRVNRDYRALHVDKIVFTQYSSFAPSGRSNQCATQRAVEQPNHFLAVIPND
jgi:hypothetical protein